MFCTTERSILTANTLFSCKKISVKLEVRIQKMTSTDNPMRDYQSRMVTVELGSATAQHTVAKSKQPGMISLASFNILLALFSVAMAVAALALLAFVLLRDSSSPPSRSAKVKRSDSFVPDWRKPEDLNPDFLQFRTLMFPKKSETNKPAKNNQIMELERREQIIDLSGLEAMMMPSEKPLPPIPAEEEAIYENAVFVDEKRVRRASSGSGSSESLRSSPFTSSTSLAASQEPMADFGSSSDMSEIDLVEVPAVKHTVRLECSSPEERC